MRIYACLLIIVFNLSLLAQIEHPIETVIQKGHIMPVSATAFSPNGKYIATGSLDNTIKVWNLKSGKEIRSFNAHSGKIKSLEFSVDGSKLLTSSVDNTSILFEVITGKILKTFKIKKETLVKTTFSFDEKYILGADNRNKFYVWNLKNEKLVHVFERAYGSELSKNYISSESNLALENHNYNDFKLTSIKTLNDSFNIDFDKSYELKFSPDNKYFVASSTKLFSKVFDNKTKKERFTLKEDNNVKCDGCNMKVAISNDSKYILTGTKKANLILWNASNGKKIKSFTNLKNRIEHLKISPNNKYVLISDDYQIRVFDIKTGKETVFIKSALLNTFEPKFGPNDNFIAIPTELNTLSVYSTSTGKKIKTFKGYLNSEKVDGLRFDYTKWTDKAIMSYLNLKTDIEISPNGKLLAIGKTDSLVQIIDVNTGKLIQRLKGHKRQIISLNFSSDSKQIVTGDGTGDIIVWDISSGKEIQKFEQHGDLIFDVNFNSDNTELVSSSWDGSVRIWNIEKSEETGYIKLDKTSGYATKFSPNDLYIVTGDLTKNIEFYESDSKEKFRNLIGHTKSISSFDFSNNGEYIISGSWDGKVKIWHVLTGMLVQKFENHKAAVTSVIAHPSENIAFSGSSDRTIKVFNTQTGKELTTLYGHNNSVTSLSISDDGSKLVSCSKDGVIKLWDLNNYKELYTYISINRNEWLVKNNAGYFDGTSNALKLINYVSGMEAISVGSLFKKYYTPGLLSRIMSGEKFEETGQFFKNEIETVPNVELQFKNFQNKFISAINDSIYKYNKEQIEIIISATNAKNIKVYNNKKLVYNEPFKEDILFRGGKADDKMITLNLVPGTNDLEVVVENKNGTESDPKPLHFNYDVKAGLTDLYILSIGINDYKNEKYDLNFAKNDAKSFTNTLKKGSKSIFNEIYEYNISDNDATKENVKSKMLEITKNIGPEDVFIFYYAGHGVMSLDEFYLVMNNVTNLYGDDEMLKQKAVSAHELLELSKEISAQKQLFVLDACQSGGALTALAQRGAAREKSLAQLARSSGTYFLTASQDAQFANEAGDLKHGLFTYAILEILTGKAGSKEDKITVNQVKSYVEIRVPELSEKYHGTTQYPTSYTFGQDFPLVIVK